MTGTPEFIQEQTGAALNQLKNSLSDPKIEERFNKPSNLKTLQDLFSGALKVQ